MWSDAVISHTHVRIFVVVVAASGKQRVDEDEMKALEAWAS